MSKYRYDIVLFFLTNCLTVLLPDTYEVIFLYTVYGCSFNDFPFRYIIRFNNECLSVKWNVFSLLRFYSLFDLITMVRCRIMCIASLGAGGDFLKTYTINVPWLTVYINLYHLLMIKIMVMLRFVFCIEFDIVIYGVNCLW